MSIGLIQTMLQISSKAKKAISLPPHILAKKVCGKLINEIKHKFNKKKDLSCSTRINVDVPIITNSYISIGNLDISGIDRKVAIYLSNMYLAHRFDLLGSGWVKNSYNSVARGIEGYRYDMNVDINEFDREGNWLYKILIAPNVENSKRISAAHF